MVVTWADHAAASSQCYRQVDPFDNMDVVVEAREITSPIPGVLILSVERYHKGDGARILIADMPGFPGFEHWRIRLKHILDLKPEHPTNRILGLRRGPGLQLKNLPCDPDYPVDPNHYLTQALPGLGGGHTPVDGISIRSNLAVALPVMLLFGGTAVWLRRRRNRP